MPNEREVLAYLEHDTFQKYTNPSPVMRRLQRFEVEYRRSLARQSHTEDDSGDEECRRLLAEQERQRKRCRAKGKKNKRIWIRDWIKQRKQKGMFNTVQETRLQDPGYFRTLLRVPGELFDELLDRVGLLITKQDTRFRPALAPDLKLAFTLNHLAEGATYSSMEGPWRVPHNSASIVVREVCEAICQEYLPDVLVTPTTPEAWLKVAEGFEERYVQIVCVFLCYFSRIKLTNQHEFL